MKVRAKYLTALVGIAVSVYCILDLVDSLDWNKVAGFLSTAKVSYLVIAIFLTVTSYLLRALRWKQMFKNPTVGFFESYRSLISGFFVNNILPARAGEVYRAYRFGRATGYKGSFTLATIFIERIADGFFISLIFLLFCTKQFSSKLAAEPLALVSSAFFALAGFSFVAYKFRNFFCSICDQAEGYFKFRFAKRAVDIVRGFVLGFSILTFANVASIVILSCAIWSIELGVFTCCFLAYSTELTLPEVATALVSANFSSLIPSAPGAIGVIEKVATGYMSRMGVAPEVAFAGISTQHIIQYLVVGIPGVFFVSKAGIATKTIDDDTTPQQRECNIGRH